ncbi:endolytic transglycosylase MltG [Microbacterium sp. MYb62]|uniref:endolytic transglycosylase MltG n=1 Tax=Microbacterium sp. MYb62 TaxID=1848690 RepID=UPI000CFD1FD3|nr:endolytic transglycosylase MltG [Microbacterium sp. MYb62]PRB13439.1 ABC transporter substrate-binding protein [Microbacterium sp. MYb62]
MSERDSATPRHDPDARLGDLFENLPEPTRQIPTVDNSAPAPGSRRAAREAAAGDTPARGTASAPSEPSPVPVRASADEAVAADATPPSPIPVRASADAAETPTRAMPQVAPIAAADATPEPVIGGGLDDLFVPHDDHVDAKPKKKKRRKGCLIALIVVLAILGGMAAVGVWVANAYGDKISDVMGWGEPDDFEPGLATGEVFVTIKDGDTGSPVSTALYEAGVTKTQDVFYDYLVDENIAVIFYPGVYRLQEKMTAEAALEALRNKDNKLENTVMVDEGGTVVSSLPEMAATLGLPLADFEAAVQDPSQYGVDAPSLEGWLFPARYTFDPEVTAPQVIQRMVDRTRESLAAAGVPDADAERVLTIASIIQREGRLDDFPKVSRVIQNRLDIDMLLQMDSTAQYGYGSLHEGVVSSSKEALESDNAWNTYKHTGLPVTPIANPSDAAIKAAMSPADGPWLYFVTINLATGDTQFSETLAEHEEGVEKWRAWCRANPEGGC